MDKRLFTSESVTEGHPDKICDNISDAILDALMAQDPMSRVACETVITTDYVMVMGEITTKAKVDYEKIVRDTIREIGYDADEKGFNCDTCEVKILLDSQSADIAMGVDKALEAKENQMSDEELEAIGAGDQGMMFGYATDETEEFMPYPIALAHSLSKKLTEVRKNGTLDYLRADGKSQVTVEYDENEKPIHINAVVISSQHAADVTQEQIHEDIRREVIDKVLPKELVDDKTKIYINPTGRFVIGGPNGDSGLTGRKIIVDTYGGYARHGVEHFPVKIVQRLIAVQLMQHVMSQRTLWQQDLQNAVKSSYPMQSVLHSQLLSWSILLVPVSFRMKSLSRSSVKTLISARQESSRC